MNVNPQPIDWLSVNLSNLSFLKNAMAHLNADVLEKIFQYLDFRSLNAAELTCKPWKMVINDRRLYWQLSKRLSSIAVPPILAACSSPASRKHKRKKKSRSTFLALLQTCHKFYFIFCRVRKFHRKI